MSESSLKSIPPKRGSLKVFLGYTPPGGQDLRHAGGSAEKAGGQVDIVIGYFEPHGRKDTIEKPRAGNHSATHRHLP